jgi:hypothetical protein
MIGMKLKPMFKRNAFAANQLVILLFILLATFVIVYALWTVLCNIELLQCGG